MTSTTLPSPIQRLPTELRLRILAVLSIEDFVSLCAIARVNQSWYTATTPFIYKRFSVLQDKHTYGLDPNAQYDLAVDAPSLIRSTKGKAWAMTHITDLMVELDTLKRDWGEWIGSEVARNNGALRGVKVLRISQKHQRTEGNARHNLSVNLKISFSDGDGHGAVSKDAGVGAGAGAKAQGQSGAPRVVDSIRVGGCKAIIGQRRRLEAFARALLGIVDTARIQLSSTSSAAGSMFDLQSLMSSSPTITPIIDCEEYVSMGTSVFTDPNRRPGDYTKLLDCIASHLRSIELKGIKEGDDQVVCVLQNALVIRDSRIDIGARARTTTCILNEYLTLSRYGRLWELAPDNWSGPTIRFEYPKTPDCPVCPIPATRPCVKFPYRLHWLSPRDPDMATKRFRLRLDDGRMTPYGDYNEA